MNLDDFLFGRELSRQLFASVRAAVEAAGPSEMQVSKSQIAFRRRRGFAWVWIPGGYLRGATAPQTRSTFRLRDGLSPCLVNGRVNKGQFHRRGHRGIYIFFSVFSASSVVNRFLYSREMVT